MKTLLILFLLIVPAVACEHGDTVPVRVVLSDGTWGLAKIDRCIAPLVAALNKGGIKTLSSCCGHGKEGLTGRGKTGYILCDKFLLEVHPQRTREDVQREYSRLFDFDASMRANGIFEYPRRLMAPLR